jgi:hypothetical protein
MPATSAQIKAPSDEETAALSRVQGMDIGN